MIKIGSIASPYVGFSLTSGGIAGLVALYSKAGFPTTLLAFAFLLPIGPINLHFTSTSSIREHLEAWKKMKDEDLITADDYAKIARSATDFVRRKLHGKDS